MASPIGHSLAGIALGVVRGSGQVSPWRWYFFAVFAANAADLDFVPGLFIGDINRFHQGISHSLLATVVFGAVVALAMRPLSRQPLRIGTAGAGFYGSHLLVDLFTLDQRAPYGIPLLWPVSSEHYTAPWPVFGGMTHGIPGDGFIVFLQQVFSSVNLKALGVEVIVLLPLLLLAWFFSGKKMTAFRRGSTAEAKAEMAEDER